jgi:hypothetical protein
VGDRRPTELSLDWLLNTPSVATLLAARQSEMRPKLSRQKNGERTGPELERGYETGSRQ